MTRYLVTMGFGLATTVLAACAPRTQIAADWKAPEFPTTPFTKVAAFAMSQDQILRRIAEDEFVDRLPDNVGVASYSLIPESDLEDVEKIKKRLKDSGIDGAAVFRLVGEDYQLQYTPGGMYTSFYGYYGWAWPMVYSPGYLRTETVVRIEANLYSVASEKLIWSALSETTDPSSARTVIDDVAGLVVGRMKRMGLIE